MPDRPLDSAPPPRRMMQSVFPKKQGVDTVALGDLDDGDSAPRFRGSERSDG